jgi:hypothetical protein
LAAGGALNDATDVSCCVLKLAVSKDWCALERKLA